MRMRLMAVALMVTMAVLSGRCWAESFDTQVNTTIGYQEEGLSIKLIHREAYFVDLQENEVNLGTKIADGLTLSAAYITDNRGTERAGIIAAASKPISHDWRLSATLHIYEGLNNAPDRYKATLTILKPVSKHWQAGIYTLGNKVSGNSNEYWEGGSAWVYRSGDLTIPIYLLLKDGGNVGVQLNFNTTL